MSQGSSVSAHRKRISTTGYSRSFAYGSASLPLEGAQQPTSPSSSKATLGTSSTLPIPPVAAPAAERYAKYKQPSSAAPYASIPGTTVNVALAFRQAQQQQHQLQRDPSPNERHVSEDASVDFDALTANGSMQQDAANSSSKKRKKAKPNDPLFRPGQLEESDNSDVSEGGRRKPRSGKRRKSDKANGHAAAEELSHEPEPQQFLQQEEFAQPITPASRKAKRKVKDPSYRPARDEAPSSESEDLDGPDREPRPKKKRAPRISTPGPRVIGAFPDTPSDAQRPTSYKLSAPSPGGSHVLDQDMESSSNYDLESEHVRQLEAAWGKLADDVHQAVLEHPSPHSHAAAAAPPLASHTRRKDTPLVPVPPVASQSIAEKESEAQHTRADAGQAAGQVIRRVLLRIAMALLSVVSALVKPLQLLLQGCLWVAEQSKGWSWTALFQATALVAFIAILLGSIWEDGTAKAWLTKKPSSKIYRAPLELPDNFEALIERLSAVERATSDISNLYHDSRSRTFTEFKDVARRLDTMQGFVNDVARDASRSTQQAGEALSQLKDYVYKSDQHTADLQSQVKDLIKQFDALSSKRSSDQSSLAGLSSQIDGLVRSAKQTDATLSHVLDDLSKAVKVDQIKEIAAEAIEKVLPSRLAVQVDPKTGKVILDPAFWNHLKSAFASHDAVPSKAKAGGKTAAVSWNDFLATNEKSLRQLIESDVQDRVAEGAILSKRAFMDLLKREIKQLKTSFEQTANENVQKIGEEILQKVEKQAHMRSSGQAAAPTLTVKLPDGKNATDLVQALIDNALLRFSKDTLGKRDYALFSGGARVIPALTSPPYEVRPTGALRRTLASITGNGIIRGRPAVTALHPDLSVGSCWSFSGPTAQLGVHLSRRVVVSDVTIEHAASDVAYDTATAPSDFEVWAVVDDQHDVRKLAEARMQAQDNDSDYMASLPPSPRHMLLAVGTYDPSLPVHIQSFPVLSSAARLEIPVSVVLLRILGTQGGSMGCLYRFRVGGEEV